MARNNGLSARELPKGRHFLRSGAWNRRGGLGVID